MNHKKSGLVSTPLKRHKYLLHVDARNFNSHCIWYHLPLSVNIRKIVILNYHYHLHPHQLTSLSRNAMVTIRVLM